MLPNHHTKRFLLVRPGAIGDGIVALPAVQRLREEVPDAQVDLVVGAGAATLLRGRCAAQHVYSYEEPRWAEFYFTSLSETALADFRRYAAIVLYLARRRAQMGSALSDQLDLPVIVWPTLPPEDAPLPISLHLQGALGDLGLAPRAQPPRIALTDQDHAFGAEFWREQGLTGQQVIALHPGSGSPRKNWPAERWADLAPALSESHGAKILVIAGPADGEQLTRLAQSWRGEDPVLVRGCSLGQVGSLLSRARLLIGNDSGIAHLAAALDTPVLVLFGPTDPRIWAPQGAHAAILTPADRSSRVDRISTAMVLEEAGRFLS